MKMLSLFSGIGAFEKALKNIGIGYELVGFSEIDKWATQSYCAIHNVSEDLNLGDVSKIKNEDLPKKVDIITYGFPCQDISVAGNQEGIKEGTRSGLLYEAERIIEYTKPKYAIAENVKNLVGKRHKEGFNKLLKRLDNYGYNNYWKILNAKDYGIPQNRERVFIVSIRKDVDDGRFKFPTPIKSNSTLRDFLELDIIDRSCNKSLLQYFHPKYHIYYKSNNGIKKVFDGNVQGYFNSDYTGKRIYSIDGVSPTLTTRNMHHFHEIRGRLLPIESFRLMGFDDADYHKVSNVRDTELYKQAGNSVVVDVLEEIFKNLFRKEG